MNGDDACVIWPQTNPLGRGKLASAVERQSASFFLEAPTVKYIIVFDTDLSGLALHEVLCKVAHEKDPVALEILQDSTNDITLMDGPKELADPVLQWAREREL